MTEKHYNLTAAQAIIIDNLIKRACAARDLCSAAKGLQKEEDILKSADAILNTLDPVYSLVEWMNDRADFIKLVIKTHSLATELRELALDQIKNPCKEALDKEGCKFTTEAIGDLCAQKKFNEVK